jgi:hypothetical protein
MGRAKAKTAKIEKATIVGDPVIDTTDRRIVYSIDVGGVQGNAWEYKDTGDAALAVVNFDSEIHTTKRALIWSAVNQWRAANRDKYAGLLKQL